MIEFDDFPGYCPDDNLIDWDNVDLNNAKLDVEYFNLQVNLPRLEKCLEIVKSRTVPDATYEQMEALEEQLDTTIHETKCLLELYRRALAMRELLSIDNATQKG